LACVSRKKKISASRYEENHSRCSGDRGVDVANADRAESPATPNENPDGDGDGGGGGGNPVGRDGKPNGAECDHGAVPVGGGGGGGGGGATGNRR